MNLKNPLTAPLATRRDFLRTASMGALLASPLAAFAQQAASADQGQGTNPTPDASLKFFPDGKVRPFAGNTVICHVPHQSRFRDEAAALHDALQRSSFAGKLGILPPESYHMTIYSGANDQARARSSWPGGVPLEASIEECSRVLKTRMQAVQLAGPFPLRVRIDAPATLAYGRASTLRMMGADPASERVLRTVRDRLAEAYQYRSKDHDAYAFHITIAYTMADLTADEMKQYRALLRQAVDRLVAETPVLELGLPEYCTFPNMYRFDTEVILRTS